MAKHVNKSQRNKQGLPRTIPSEVKLQVRKRCGFGCVICGIALYEYEHFNPEFKKASVHDPNGITLLCPNHHAKKTKGVLSNKAVKDFNENPKALRQGFAHERFNLSSENLTISLGAVTTTNIKQYQVLIQLEGDPLLSVRPGEDADDSFLISANLRDKNGNTILKVVDNEWEVPADYWDIKNVGKKIEIRSAERNIELILRQDAENTVHVERLRMHHLGYQIDVFEGKPMTIVSPYNQKSSFDSITLSGASAGVMVYKHAIAFGLSSAFTPEQGYEMLKQMADGEMPEQKWKVD